MTDNFSHDDLSTQQAPTRSRAFSRRTVLRAALGVAGTTILAACGGNATTPTTGGSAPTTAATVGATATTARPAGTATGATGGAAATTASSVTVAGSPTRASTSPASSPAGAASPAAQAVDGKIPSPAEGVPDAYTKLPKPYKSSTSPPGKGGKVTAFQITYDPPTPGRDQNQYWQELEKRMNVSPYEVTLAPSANYDEKFAATIAGGDIPDLVMFTPPPGYARLLQQGAFTDLTSYLTGDGLKEFPNLATFPSVLWKNVAFNKKIYGVPRPRFLANNAFYFRQDWAEKVGFGQQKNADDVFNMFVAMTKNDPDGNGKPDTFGLSSSSPRPGMALDVLQQLYRVPNGWRQNPDGTLTRSFETEEFKQALAYTRKLWEAGAFHPDAATLTTNQNKDLFFGSKIGAYSDGLAGLMGSGGARGKTHELTPNANVTAWVPVGHDGGKPTYHKYIGFFGFTAISAKAGKDKERVKELLRILNYMASPFGSEEAIFNGNGIEGVHHTVKPDGTRIKTDLGKTEIGPLTGLTNAPQVAYYDVAGDAQDMQKIQVDLLSTAIDNPTWGLFSQTEVAKSAELTQLEADRRVAIVLGREPLSAWDQFIKDWKSRGGDQIRKEYEEALKA